MKSALKVFSNDKHRFKSVESYCLSVNQGGGSEVQRIGTSFVLWISKRVKQYGSMNHCVSFLYMTVVIFQLLFSNELRKRYRYLLV